MDGNGRWAEERGLDRLRGHAAGADAALKAIAATDELKIPFITLFAFSSENFKRPAPEVKGIFEITAGFLENGLLPLIKERGYRVRFIGELAKLPVGLLDYIAKVNVAGLNNTGMTVVIALAYGGREEIASAFNLILARRILDSDDSPITYDEIEKSLQTATLPDPDAVVRYGGYKRLSNFMPLQCAYSELFFFEKYWPDFQREDLYYIYNQYCTIKRNFGDTAK